MNLKAILATMAALMVLVSSLIIPTGATAATTNLSNELTTEYLNTTDSFGGGSHFYVKFGQDAAFGVVWGNEENPNSIYVVSYMSRYLGYIDVYDGQGNIVKDDHAVKVYSVYAVKLDSLIEFSDGTGDGQVRYYRTYDANTGEYSDYHALRPMTEPMYKKVSLNTSWEATAPVLVEDGNNKSWTFSLTAQDLPYQAIADGANVEGVLDNITLTFQLDASTVHKDNISVPQYAVNVTNGLFYNLQKGSDEAFSGNVTSYHVKWGKEIQGWDFDASNQHPALLLEFDSLVGNMIPPAASAVMALNQYQLMIRAMGEEDRVRTSNGDTAGYDGATGSLAANKQALSSNSLTFGGERARVGTFEWAQNCTVDGEEQASHGQIMGVWSAHAWRFGGMQFAGMAVMSGITYPGGNVIIQDPAVSSEAVTDLTEVSASTTDPTGTGSFSLPVGLGIIVLLAAVVLIAAVLVMHRRGGKNGPVNYEKKDEKEQNDWSQYYEKK